MRKVSIFLIPILVVANSCCGHRLSKELSAIEAILPDHPDSALVMIDSIDTLSLKSVRAKAEYTLLKAKCLDKNYIDDASLLKDMVAYEPYYQRYGSTNDKMLYGYYLADQFYDSGQFEEASVRLLKVLEYSEKNNDCFYSGQSCWLLALIYLKTYNYVEELKYIKRAYDYLREGGFDYHADYAEIQLADAFLKNGNRDKSFEYYDGVLDRAREANDSSLLGYALTSSALSLLTGRNPEPEKVVLRMGEAERLEYEFDSENFGDLAMAYHLLGKDEDAFRYLEKAFDMSSDDLKAKLYVSSFAYKIYKDRKMYDKAFPLVEAILHYNDSTTIKVLGQSVVKAQLLYFQEKENAVTAKLSQSRVTLVVSVLLFCSLICIFVLSSKIKRDKLELEYNKKIQQYTMSINELKSTLDTLVRRVDEKGKEHNALKFTFSAFDNLFDEYYHSPGNEDTALLTSFETMLNKFRNDVTFIASFESMVDATHNGIVTIAGKECRLKDSDLYLYAFMVAETSYPTISVILGVNLPAIYIRVKRLKTRILESDPEHKDEIMHYLASRPTNKSRKMS